MTDRYEILKETVSTAIEEVFRIEFSNMTADKIQQIYEELQILIENDYDRNCVSRDTIKVFSNVMSTAKAKANGMKIFIQLPYQGSPLEVLTEKDLFEIDKYTFLNGFENYDTPLKKFGTVYFFHKHSKNLKEIELVVEFQRLIRIMGPIKSTHKTTMSDVLLGLVKPRRPKL